MSDYLFGHQHERIDRFLVKHFDRPTRQERYENRQRTLGRSLDVTATAVPFMLGTGRVRAGQMAVRAGHKTISTSLPGRGWFGLLKESQWTTAKTIRVIAGAKQVGQGLAMQRQGRILQGVGLGIGFWRL